MEQSLVGYCFEYLVNIFTGSSTNTCPTIGWLAVGSSWLLRCWVVWRRLMNWLTNWCTATPTKYSFGALGESHSASCSLNTNAPISISYNNLRYCCHVHAPSTFTIDVECSRTLLLASFNRTCDYPCLSIVHTLDYSIRWSSSWGPLTLWPVCHPHPYNFLLPPPLYLNPHMMIL